MSKTPKPVCTCDPRKLTSRGRCAVHGFKTDPLLAKRQAFKSLPRHELAGQVIELADAALDAADGDGEPFYSKSECAVFRVLLDVARERLQRAPKKRIP